MMWRSQREAEEVVMAVKLTSEELIEFRSQHLESNHRIHIARRFGAISLLLQ